MDFSGDYLKNQANKLNRSDIFISDLDEYVSKLQHSNLPVIFSPLHWSLMMDMEYTSYRSVLDNREGFYNHFRIRKKNGEHRHISAPRDELYKIQLWLKTFVLDQIKFPDYLTSYQKEKSILNNARFHVAKELVVKFDLEDFFDSITQNKVYGIFKFLGYNSSVAIDMAKACCIPKRSRISKNQKDDLFACLPQGAPTSPSLSNISAAKMDLRLNEYASSRNLSYSRYADDITFSGSISDKPKESTIKHIIVEEGFILNISKTKYVHRSNKQIVTGLCVNETISIPKKKRKKIHTHLHNCTKFGPFENLRKMDLRKLNYREWLLGNIIFIQMVHPQEGRLMRERFDLINWL